MFRSTLILAAGYGAIGFAIGFLFGALREMVFIPQFGEAAGRLLEFPLVTGLICYAGYRLGRRAVTRAAALLVGLGGMAFLLAIESAFALGVMGETPADYLASFDVTRGALFPFGLAAMAIAPLFGKRA